VVGVFGIGLGQTTLKSSARAEMVVPAAIQMDKNFPKMDRDKVRIP